MAENINFNNAKKQKTIFDVDERHYIADYMNLPLGLLHDRDLPCAYSYNREPITKIKDDYIKNIFQIYLEYITSHCRLRTGFDMIEDGMDGRPNKSLASRISKSELINRGKRFGMLDHSTKHPSELLRFRQHIGSFLNVLVEICLLTGTGRFTIDDEDYIKRSCADDWLEKIMQDAKYDTSAKAFTEYNLQNRILKEEFFKKFESMLYSDNMNDLYKFTENDVKLYFYLLYNDTIYRFGRTNEIYTTNLAKSLYEYQNYIYSIKSFENHYDELIINKYKKEVNKLKNRGRLTDWSDEDIYNILYDKYKKSLSVFKETNNYKDLKYNPTLYQDLIKNNCRHRLPEDFELYNTVVNLDELRDFACKDYSITKTYFNKKWTSKQWLFVYKLEVLLGLINNYIKFGKNIIINNYSIYN